ncbi:hypothetical protein NEF87_000145 [Candidatus Lokiarchaeum ossiferum]|uniref:Uncharacterized protein n=1 Tax=Candidatus Lokiarchaeum ossiferum TaxID=2951803 RepID=A0ABY6HK04_9ARCH|nr:hypothetical protein NEF87_000145 [Candidatus Lokiarchaeum sp. B-35]
MAILSPQASSSIQRSLVSQKLPFPSELAHHLDHLSLPVSMTSHDIRTLGRFLYRTVPPSAYNSISLNFLESLAQGYEHMAHHGHTALSQIPQLAMFAKLI